MKTKILYILVSSDSDIYLEQAFVSMYSARYYMPDAHIALLTDSKTNESFDNPRRKNLLRFVDELIPIDLGSEYTAVQRSRILKTSARKYTKGDFIFLDTDTVLTDSIYEIDDFQFNIGAVCDLHQYFDINITRNGVLKNLRTFANYKPSNIKYYFNSGVIYAKDNIETHAFYEKWNSLWRDGQAKGLYLDQPSFLITNEELHHPIIEMNGIYNCQIAVSLEFFSKSKILHYFNSYSNCISPVFTKDFMKTIKCGSLSQDQEKQIINCKNSFKTPSIILTDDNAIVYNDRIFYSIMDIYKHNRTAYKLLTLGVRIYSFLVKTIYK